MTSMTEASSSQAAISVPKAVRNIRAPRDVAWDWIGMTLMECLVSSSALTIGSAREADQKDISMWEGNR
jgi:hypothetical protein